MNDKAGIADSGFYMALFLALLVGVEVGIAVRSVHHGGAAVGFCVFLNHLASRIVIELRKR